MLPNECVTKDANRRRLQVGPKLRLWRISLQRKNSTHASPQTDDRISVWFCRGVLSCRWLTFGCSAARTAKRSNRTPLPRLASHRARLTRPLRSSSRMAKLRLERWSSSSSLSGRPTILPNMRRTQSLRAWWVESGEGLPSRVICREQMFAGRRSGASHGRPS